MILYWYCEACGQSCTTQDTDEPSQPTQCPKCDTVGVLGADYPPTIVRQVYLFPAKTIAKIIAEETVSKFARIVKHDKSFTFDMGDEMREMRQIHLNTIRDLKTYEEIHKWLKEYRRMSLREWVDSL